MQVERRNVKIKRIRLCESGAMVQRVLFLTGEKGISEGYDGEINRTYNIQYINMRFIISPTKKSNSTDLLLTSGRKVYKTRN